MCLPRQEVPEAPKELYLLHGETDLANGAALISCLCRLVEERSWATHDSVRTARLQSQLAKEN